MFALENVCVVSSAWCQVRRCGDCRSEYLQKMGIYGHRVILLTSTRTRNVDYKFSKGCGRFVRRPGDTTGYQVPTVALIAMREDEKTKGTSTKTRKVERMRGAPSRTYTPTTTPTTLARLTMHKWMLWRPAQQTRRAVLRKDKRPTSCFLSPGSGDAFHCSLCSVRCRWPRKGNALTTTPAKLNIGLTHCPPNAEMTCVRKEGEVDDAHQG